MRYFTEAYGVAFYLHRLSGPGGAERMVCQLAGALAERGRDVHLLSWDQIGAKSFYPLHPAVAWSRLGFSSGAGDKIRRTRELIRYLKKNSIRVLVGFVMSGDKTVYAAAMAAGVKLVVAERNAPSMYWLRYSGIQRWLSFALMRLADHITVQAPGFVEGYPERLRPRISVIPNPVPSAVMHARPDVANGAGRFELLAVSRLDSVQKRVACLVKAFSLIARDHPEWDLRVVGDGPDSVGLKQLVNQLGLEERVRIEPARTDVFGLYVQAHLFAIPSLWEGFPNALAEAMSHGLPAIGFADAAGVADLIGDTSGWLAPGLDDESSLAQTLAVAMGDAAERACRGSQARKEMESFSPDRQFDRWDELIREVMEGKPH
ncbi:MAG: glycosyltransferase [Pseudomonadota bacterium]